ncbi:MAG: vitamin K epoxide reductase family protein [Gemmatimonadota bacterium]
MTKRMVIATLALAGVGVATYLTLYSLGALGELACGSGGCETVQASRWSNFIGLPVAAWGLGFYITLFVVAMVSTRPGFEESAGMSNVMLVLTAWGFLFSGWLTWIELGVLKAICRYCVVSALIVTAAFAVSLLEWRELRRSEPAT